MYYLRARYYNPYIGRFISEDSYWGEDINPLSLNLYTYCENDPIRYVDPSGHAVTQWDKENVSSEEDKETLANNTERYNNATTQEEKDQIHRESEAIREKYREDDEVGTGDGNTVRRGSKGDKKDRDKKPSSSSNKPRNTSSSNNDNSHVSTSNSGNKSNATKIEEINRTLKQDPNLEYDPEVEIIQASLKAMGYYIQVDGKFGPKTEKELIEQTGKGVEIGQKRSWMS